MIDYDEFETATVVIEARYASSLLLWDRAGSIWSRLKDHFPELKFQTATPHQQVFESPQLRASIELENFRITARGLKAEIHVAELAQEILEVCSDRLQFTSFSRLGFRTVKIHKFSSIDEAIARVDSMVPTSLTNPLAQSTKVLSFQIGVKHESETAGLNASMRVEEREFILNLPWEAMDRMTPEWTKQFGKEYVAVLDSDYYTTGTTNRESLSFIEWAKQADRYIQKYWKSVL